MTRPPFDAFTDRDVELVSAQLGRPARDVIGIAARCVCGAPTVVATRPRLSNGTPFPTLYYLTHPAATVAVSHLEAEGRMPLYAAELEADPAVREAGPTDAPMTVVFAHGYTLSMDSWHFQRRHLQDRFGSEVRLVFYDQRGHGLSGKSSRDNSTIAQLASDLNSVISATAPTGPIVAIGHSMGGMTVLGYAVRHEDAVRERVLGVGLVAGIIPAWQAARTEIVSALRQA